MRQRIRSAMGQQTLAWLGVAGLGVFAMVLALLKGAAAPQSTGADWAGHPSDDWITVNKDCSSKPLRGRSCVPTFAWLAHNG